MKVFVTGAAGFIGRAVTQELISHGHTVLGLARSDANAEIIRKAGGEPHKGDLEDLESLKDGARSADGVIHLAFVPDFKNFERSVHIDLMAIEAMGSAIENSGKPLIIASGTLMSPHGVLADEDTQPERNNPPFSERAKSADQVLALKDRGVKGMVIKLSPTVHGTEDMGFVPMLIGFSRRSGEAVYVGNGENKWPAVHRLDAAVLFRLALENGRAGASYNAVAEQGVQMKEIMGIIGKHLGLPAVGKSIEEASKSLQMFARVTSMDNPTSSEKTQRELNWTPKQIPLLEDIQENYFGEKPVQSKFV